MPRNRSHQIIRKGKGFMNVKTALAREFEKDLTERLGEFEEAFMLFKNAFKPKLHYIQAVYTIYTPLEFLITKEGHISNRAVDTDAHKVFRDTIYSCLGIDDKVERSTQYYTPASVDGLWNYSINLKLENICQLTNTPSWISSSAECQNLL